MIINYNAKKQENFYSINGQYYHSPYYAQPYYDPSWYKKYLYVYKGGTYNPYIDTYGHEHAHTYIPHQHVIEKPKVIHTVNNKVYYKTYPMYKKNPSWYWQKTM